MLTPEIHDLKSQLLMQTADHSSHAIKENLIQFFWGRFFPYSLEQPYTPVFHALYFVLSFQLLHFYKTSFSHTATDFADWLVRTLDMPFRDAHHVTGAAVKRAEALGVDLPGLPLAELQALSPGITAAVFDVLTPAASAASRTSLGGTAPDQVRRQVALWRERLA